MRYYFSLLLCVCIGYSYAAPKKKPKIQGQQPVSISTNESYTIQLSDLIVDDDNYPFGYTLTVYEGRSYSIFGNTVTPDAGFHGKLRVPVTVNNGDEESKRFDFVIEVSVGNDVAPTITGQVAVSTQEGTAVTISLSDLTVDDPDSNYPDGFTLAVSAGANYTVSGTTITPDAGFVGTLSVPLTVNDGAEDSAPFNFQITVTATPNQAPVITGQVPLSTPENNSLTISLSHLTVSDPDNAYPNDFTLQVLAGTNYSVSGTTITPANGFSGTLSIPVTVNDGTDTSQPFTLTVTVTAVNTKPTITGQVALSTPEDTPLTISLSDLTVSDPDNTYPTGFSLSVQAGTNYTVSGTTITPSAGFHGALSVPVTVNDGTDTSDPFTLQVSVSNVNTPPVITGQQPLTTPFNTAITLRLADLTVNDPDNTYPMGFSMQVAAGTNYTISGTTVTPAAGFTGTLTVPVTVNDGTDTSAPFNVAITVSSPSNVAPTITGQVPLSVEENQSITLALNNFTVSDPDDNYPLGFTLNVLPGANYTALGNTVTPAAGFSGTLTVKITVNDGNADSQPFNVSITVNPHQNAKPVITGQQTLTIDQNEPLLIELSQLTVTDPDNTYPDDFTLSVIGGPNYSVSGNIITPAKNFTGLLAVKVIINDGTNDSAPFNLKVTVIDNVVNVPPTITGQVGLTTFKATPITLTLAQLTVSDPDNTYPAGFTLKVLPGLNYTVVGNSVRPSATFLGTLAVNVTVNDGTASSDPFTVKIQVIEKTDLQIIGQLPLATNEDSTITIKLTDLKVNDTSHKYPVGFTLTLSPGDNYTLNGLTVSPAPDYNGNLSVPVVVKNANNQSSPFNLLIVINPVNDAPTLAQFETDPIPYNKNDETSPITQTAVVQDVDDDFLLLAEIGFHQGSYQPGADKLEFVNTENIRGVFDEGEGILSLIGKASKEEYTAAIRSVQYSFVSSDTVPSENKAIYIRLNDGKTLSDEFVREIRMGETFDLNIPSAFTPNDDQANDTWKITSSKQSSLLENAVVRVYNVRGMMVYEAKGIDREWDGKMNGQALPADTYYYIIDLNQSFSRSRYKGIVVILK